MTARDRREKKNIEYKRYMLLNGKI